MFTKASIFNLALGALLLQRQISDPNTDTTNANKVLLIHWDIALNSTLQDMDLTSTSSQVTLSLIEQDPNLLWQYSYAYPTNCVFFRRIQSRLVSDNKTNHIPKQVLIKDARKVIYTNKQNAIGEFIPKDIPLSSLSPLAGLTVAYRLAILSATLIVGKGAKTLKEDILKQYILSKAEAQEKDRLESFSFNDDWIESEWVEARQS